jgi:TatA/E family protein of Tat protein translocase
MDYLGFPEMVIILVIALLLFGARALPAMGRGIGDGIRRFVHERKPQPWTFTEFPFRNRSRGKLNLDYIVVPVVLLAFLAVLLRLIQIFS